jgi:hypothetical protein
MRDDDQARDRQLHGVNCMELIASKQVHEVNHEPLGEGMMTPFMLCIFFLVLRVSV